jgi:hypothetical protein
MRNHALPYSIHHAESAEVQTRAAEQRRGFDIAWLARPKLSRKHFVVGVLGLG